jgi:hypothetical protein
MTARSARLPGLGWTWGVLVAVALAALGGGWSAGAAEPGHQALPARQAGQPVSREALKELVTQEMSLQHPGLSSWTVVNRLRDWGYANIDLATPHALLERNASFDFRHMGAAEFFTAFFQDRGGVWCGGAAYALAELYRLFGYRASIVDYGHPDVLTHVVTLVRIDDNGTRRTVVQDPTFNVAYAAREGTPLDYLDLLTALKEGQRQAVRLLQGRFKEKEILVHPRDAHLPVPYVRGKPGRHLVRVLPNGMKKYRAQVSLEAFAAPLRKKIGRFLAQEGYPADMLYLFLFPLKGTDPAIVEAARRLTGRE